MNQSITIPKGIYVLDFLNDFAKRIEHFRIQNHLKWTERQLRNKDVSSISKKLKKRRLQNLDHLHHYWKAGEFPKNMDFPKKRIPYFVDAANVPCAMAYLILQSDKKDLVKEVQKTNNHIYINDIKNGPVLDWIRESGLTQEEAAKIQPTYWPGMGELSFLEQHITLITIIISAIFLITMEWVSYKISSWLFVKSKKKRNVTLGFFSLYNIAIALLLGIIFYEFFKY